MIGEKSERKSKVCILQMGYGFPHGTARSSDFLYNAPEFRGDSLPEYQLIEYNPSEKSSFMAHRDWIEIATIIETLYPEVDGFVILMGTDTMAYCASALSFMLQNLAKPVVVTGGAVPLCEVYNDSRRNLIVSMLFACSTQLCEVCIFFNDVLLRGNRTTKLSEKTLEAFCSPNYPPLATLSTCTFKNPDFRYDLLLPPPRGRLLVHKRLEAAISVIKLFPGFPAHTLDCAISSGQLRGVVMECFGSGNAPIKRCQGLRSVLSKALGMGIVVVITSQCVYGPVTLETYEAGRHLIELGVISAKDMTLEAIVMKLSFLLGKNLELQDVVHQMNQNICGEMSCTMSHMKNKL